ncbi:MAG: wax ester/triacylglycerol synthase family O-acyltransferase [Phycisphaerales bacterium]|nr:wax ester/triacylglycerol synthase family O-acyltransferase [Phycisphaerales bacterium]
MKKTTATAETSLVRPLGFWEATTAINARLGLGASTMIILGQGTGPLDEETVHAAARGLFDHQTILQCRLSEGDPVPAFIQDVRFDDIPITMQHAETEDDLIVIWEQMLHEELPDRRRLWEVRFVPSPRGERWRVFIKIHHAVADGRSMAGMLDQFLDFAARILRGEELPGERTPIAPPAEQRVASRVSREQWQTATEMLPEPPPITPWPLDHEATIEERRTRIAVRSMSADDVEALHQACHDRGTTILGAFVAAISLVHARHAGGVVDTDTMIPIDMRRLFAEQPHKHDLQMAAYVQRVFLPGVRSDDDPWVIAAKFRTGLEAGLTPDGVPPWDFLPEDVSNSVAEWMDFEGHYRHGFCATNVGVLPFTGDYPPLSTERIEVTAAVHFGGFPILAPILTHKGVLRVNFTWTEPLMDQTTADAWIDDVWTLFTQLA